MRLLISCVIATIAMPMIAAGQTPEANPNSQWFPDWRTFVAYDLSEKHCANDMGVTWFESTTDTLVNLEVRGAASTVYFILLEFETRESAHGAFTDTQPILERMFDVQTNGGETISSVNPVSFPSVGDDSAAFAITVTENADGSDPVAIDVLAVVQGSHLGFAWSTGAVNNTQNLIEFWDILADTWPTQGEGNVSDMLPELDDMPLGWSQGDVLRGLPAVARCADGTATPTEATPTA